MTYLNDFTEIFPISMTFLNNMMRRYHQLDSVFKQQMKLSSKEIYLFHSQTITNSPSSASFNNLLSLIRSENELIKIHHSLEQLLEKVLYLQCESASSSLSNIQITNYNIKDMYELVTRFNSTRLVQKLLEADVENSAYLLDLKRVKKL